MDMNDLTTKFKDKHFVVEFFRDCTTGQDVQKKFIDNNITLNSTQLIADLVHWLIDAENDTSGVHAAATEQKKSFAKQDVAELNKRIEERDLNQQRNIDEQNKVVQTSSDEQKSTSEIPSDSGIASPTSSSEPVTSTINPIQSISDDIARAKEEAKKAGQAKTSTRTFSKPTI